MEISRSLKFSGEERKNKKLRRKQSKQKKFTEVSSSLHTVFLFFLLSSFVLFRFCQKVGDVMGVGVLHSTCEVFFTHNGRFLGVVGLLPSPASSSSASSARTKQPTPSSPSPNDPNGGKPFHFHPLHLFHFAVGLRSVGEKITVSAKRWEVKKEGRSRRRRSE